MRILFTNDDGYDSEGLHAVADLFKDDYEIAVIAPDVQRSAASASLTMPPNTITYREVGGYGYKVYAVSGTPVDCVKLGVKHIFTPDIVVSGINLGRNLGGDILYSGTVSAASDAIFLGIRAFALSLCKKKTEITRADFDACAAYFRAHFDMFTAIDLPKTTLLDINFPTGTPIGVKFCRMSTSSAYAGGYGQSDKGFYLADKFDNSLVSADSDERNCLDGFITIVPLTIDRTDYATLEKLNGEDFEL